MLTRRLLNCRGHGWPHREQGFALLAVLWVMVGVAALGLMVSLAGREAVASARNRMDLTRAAWRAEACIERTRAVIDGILTGLDERGLGGRGAEWNTLNRAVLASPWITSAGCDVTLRASGSRIDINAADEEVLQRLFAALRTPPARADSLAHALLDWRDADDVPRPYGAERAWYQMRERHLPRNGPFADIREISRVRGFETPVGLDSLLGVEPSRIALDHAPLMVLASLPGFTAETVARIAERRMRGVPIRDLLALSGELSPGTRESLLARHPDLARLTTTEPDAWIVTSRARVGTPPVTAMIEVRLVRAGSRAAIVRRRSWVS